MKKKIQAISILCMVVTIILMALPYGVAMNFYGDGGPAVGERFTSYHSYFSMMPIGYANWFPIITALLSIVALTQLINRAIRNKNSNSTVIQPVLACPIISIITSLFSWMIFGTFTAVGLIISILHVVTLALQIVQKRSSSS